MQSVLADGELLRACTSQTGSVTCAELPHSAVLEAENPTETKSMQEWGWQSVGHPAQVCLYQVRVGKCGKRMTLHKLG